MKVKKSVSIKGPFVSIGKRNGEILCAVPELDVLPPGLVLGENPLPPKERENPEALWIVSCSWVASRDAGKFTILRLDDAIRKKEVKLLKRVKFIHTNAKGKQEIYRGDIVVPRKWEPSQKQPRCVGVINAKGWGAKRIESTLVHEADKNKPPRNREVVAKLVLK